MNLMCPNCQKMLTVPEQYAGQLMKCPLCAGNFTVPGLPPSMLASAPPPADSYPVRQDPAAPAPRAPEPPVVEPIAPRQPSGATSPGGYARTLPLTLNPKMVPWIAPVCLVLVFVLMFFPWVGYYPGGYGVVTQNGWYAAFGSYSAEPVYVRKVLGLASDELPEKARPNMDALLMVFVFLFLPALLLAIASIVIPMLKLQLPPAVQQLMQWRWGITGAVTLLAFLFLFLQSLIGFSIEAQGDYVLNPFGQTISKSTGTAEDQQIQNIKNGILYSAQAVERTYYFSLAFWLMVLASLGCLAQYWLDQRERTRRPLPRLEVMW